MHTYRITIKLRVKPENKEKRVAILGSGPAGLVSAKYALENNIVPVILEKRNKPGGLWAEGTAIWDGMHTNVSRYSVMFSDHTWPKGASIIPSSRDVLNYLMSYIRQFDLEKHIRYNSNVEIIKQLPNKKWQVTFTDTVSGERITEVFDYMICSTGLHCKAKVPHVKHMDKFRGHIMHSTDYRANDERIKGKRVIVVGNSYSGVEISSHMVGHAASVVNVFNRPYLVLSRLLKLKSEQADASPNAYHIMPIDLLFGRELTFGAKSKEEERESKIKLYSQLCPYQTNKKKSHPALYYELNDDEPIREAVTDNYYPFVRTGQIIPKQAKIKQFEKYGVTYEDGTFERADVVLFCTGYKLCLDYFEPSVVKKLRFDPNNEKMPILLYKYTVHPDLENMAVVGGISGLFFAGFELQARWAIKLFKGEKRLPPRDQIDEEMRQDEAKRDKAENNQYPHGIYNELVDKLAVESDALPDFESIAKISPKLYEMLWKNGTIPSHFCFNDDNKRSISLAQMIEVDEIINQQYTFTDEELKEHSTSKLAEKFSQNYKIPLHLFRD